jgi:hypothetical protein
MLMRLDSRLTRRLLAEIQESANLITEIRERTVVDRLLFIVPHQYAIISYYDILVQRNRAEWSFALELREN